MGQLYTVGGHMSTHRERGDDDDDDKDDNDNDDDDNDGGEDDDRNMFPLSADACLQCEERDDTGELTR